MSNISINCPTCQLTATRRMDLTSSGTQRYKRSGCSEYFTDTAIGRLCLEDRQLS